jgi:hypothetical protein
MRKRARLPRNRSEIDFVLRRKSWSFKKKKKNSSLMITAFEQATVSQSGGIQIGFWRRRKRTNHGYVRVEVPAEN